MQNITTCILFLLVITIGYSQNNRLISSDSIKEEYKYIFPFFGSKVHKKGFDLPYSAGIMLNTFYAIQDIEISNMSLGFSDGILPDVPLTDVSHLIEFGKVEAEVLSISVRPDLWVLPFLNIYGIFGKTYARIIVQVSSPINLNAIADLEGTSYGVGMTGAGGIGKLFFVLDGNWVWSNLTNFKEPVRSTVLSFRLGKTFDFKNNPKANVAFWLGGMRVRIRGITEGTITLGEVLPEETWERRDEIVDDYYAWYDDATPLEKVTADKILTPLIENLKIANGNGTIHYKLNKRPEQEWNMLVGGQWQINKHYQFRV